MSNSLSDYCYKKLGGSIMSNTYDEDNVEQKHNYLFQAIHEIFKRLDGFIQELSDEEITELSKYLRYLAQNHNKENCSTEVNMEKSKAFLLLFSRLSTDHDAKKILSYLESVEFGWHNDEYYLSNPCLRKFIYSPNGHCKKAEKMGYTELAVKSLDNIYDIFFDDEYGATTLFIFNYCLASLFSSVLNRNNISTPFFLQIACDHTSALYQLITEIVEICDVNSGLLEKCNKTDCDYRYCGYVYQTYYPTQSASQDIENLICNFKDNPVLVVGYENERNYHALLREIANIPIKKKSLDLRNRFNLLPIFICPAIKSSFDNVFNMDLTDFEISQEYLTLVKKNKQVLASWVLKLVMDTDRDTFQPVKKNTKQRIILETDLLSREIVSYMNYTSQRYSNLTLKNSRNVGFLNFFFKQYLNIFLRLCTFSSEEKLEYFECGGKPLPQTKEETIHMITDESEQHLAQLHHQYLPAPTGVGIKNKEAARLAKQIEGYYRKLKVYIRAIPFDIKEKMYIFNVDTLNETKDTDVSKNAATVQRRLKKYEYFRIDLKDKTAIKLFVAEKPLADNSLIEILTHKDFTESTLEIPYAMGFDETGAMCIEDIKEFPHLLLGGATRSGKSTALMSLLMSIAFKHRTGDVNVLILDLLGKTESDFDAFNDQPFLSFPVINGPINGAKAILLLYEEKVRRLSDKNLPQMPYIVCIIDEFPRLFFDVSNKGTRLIEVISDLLSSGRHAKIHLVLAAQNPVKEHMKGDISNITARMAFKCAHYQNSVAMLGRSGAQGLIGRGQMIFDSPLQMDRRLQGSYIAKKDMIRLLDEIKKDFVQQNKYPFIINDLDSSPDLPESSIAEIMQMQTARFRSNDEILLDAIMWSLSQSKIAKSRLLEYLRIGDPKAVKILTEMERLGLVHQMHGNLGWEVLPKGFEDMPEQALDFLKNRGVDEFEIRNAFGECTEVIGTDTEPCP